MNGKRRKTNLNVAWIDLKKAYYKVIPDEWMIKLLRLIGAAYNVQTLLDSNMTN